MKISFDFNSTFIHILNAFFRSIVFNSICIAIFGLLYFFVSQPTDKMPFDQYFILSTKAQFWLPTQSDHLNNVEKDVILFQKVFGLIGYTIIILRFSKILF